MRTLDEMVEPIKITMPESVHGTSDRDQDTEMPGRSANAGRKEGVSGPSFFYPITGLTQEK